MKENPLVTIVVPMYNVEKYIEKCINSLLNQTYQNIEIIIINDGTKDNSLAIAERKAKEDRRIKIISQPNQGLSAARNTGIDNASGDYICFVDSDDFIHTDYVKLLLECILENDVDISVCNFFYIDEQGNTWKRKEKEKDRKIFFFYIYTTGNTVSKHLNFTLCPSHGKKLFRGLSTICG